MRLAFMSTMSGSPWGGSEELWAAAAAHARSAGHEVLACVNRWPDVPAPLARLMDQGVRIERIDRPKGLRRVLARFRGSRARALNEFKPDVVCVSQGAAYEVAIQRRFHDIIDCLKGGATPYIVVCQLNTDASPLNDRSRALARSFFRGAHRVAFVAERNLAGAVRHLACELETAVVVRNPVNLASTEPIPWPSPDDSGGLRLACVARLETAYKAQDILLETLAAPVWRTRPWRLTLCGVGPDENHLRELVKLKGLESKVEFAGQISDLRGLWARQHALVLPSREEGTPLAMVEAMLCTRPAIVTDVGGNAEWVREGETGYLAAAPTVREIGAALERAWSARSRLAYLGLSARETALRQYDPNPGKTLVDLMLAAVGTAVSA